LDVLGKNGYDVFIEKVLPVTTQVFY